MERKSAVFSLAISQVLIINMFEHDVGPLYNGANYGLLKTVFDVNLQLFQAPDSPKTLLLFVIRDHAQTPLESLADTLRSDLKKTGPISPRFHLLPILHIFMFLPFLSSFPPPISTFFAHAALRLGAVPVR